MKDPITREQALEKLASFIEAQGLSGQKILLDCYGAYYHFTRGIWGDEATLDVELDRGGNLRVKLGWSSTDRTTAMARVAIENYLEALTIAERIQAFGDQLGLVETTEQRTERRAREKEEQQVKQA